MRKTSLPAEVAAIEFPGDVSAAASLLWGLTEASRGWAGGVGGVEWSADVFSDVFAWFFMFSYVFVWFWMCSSVFVWFSMFFLCFCMV